MKKILVAAMVMNGFVVSADTSYEVIGKDEGIVQFDYENGGKKFTVVGANGQEFITRWSGCSADKVYAYRDNVALVCTEMEWMDFPATISGFDVLDWEQRAPAIREGKYVVFMNEKGQFLCCKVVDVKDKSRGDDKDLLVFEFKIYDADEGISNSILQSHEEKKKNYVIEGENEGVASFDFENNSGRFLIRGANGQMFETEWSGCGGDKIYAYRDNVKLVSDEVDWADFPADAESFADLDWEQRAPTITKGKYVVFLNAAGQFLCCKILDVKNKTCEADDDLLVFEFKVYDADAAISEKIIREHEEKTSGYLIEGKDEGTAQFDFENNSGRFTVVGANGQRFVTRWSGCGANSIYAYRDDVKNVGVCESMTAFPDLPSAFIEVERGQRVVTAHSDEYIVFMNTEGQFLCCHITDLKTKSRDGEDDLLTFDYKIYDADALVLDAIVDVDNRRGESRLSDDFIITADLASETVVKVPEGADETLIKVRIVRIVTIAGRRVKRDITDYLEIPKAANGIIDLTKIQVKAMYASEVFNVERGAKLVLDKDRIYIETANTREGLIYDFYEANDLNSLMNTVKDSKVGDGTPFIPKVSSDSANSRFFAIKVRAM